MIIKCEKKIAGAGIYFQILGLRKKGGELNFEISGGGKKGGET